MIVMHIILIVAEYCDNTLFLRYACEAKLRVINTMHVAYVRKIARITCLARQYTNKVVVSFFEEYSLMG